MSFFVALRTHYLVTIEDPVAAILLSVRLHTLKITDIDKKIFFKKMPGSPKIHHISAMRADVPSTLESRPTCLLLAPSWR